MDSGTGLFRTPICGLDTLPHLEDIIRVKLSDAKQAGVELIHVKLHMI